ncbi:MAG: hypothetical protein FJZ87_05450 [Chloroflexi bacterium]|nr:hypothetical protein [Chloroflexota bacterium]
MTTPFICHVEWGTTDPESLRKLLYQLFGWGFQSFAPNYLIYVSAEGGASVGIMQSDQMRAGGSPQRLGARAGYGCNDPQSGGAWRQGRRP